MNRTLGCCLAVLAGTAIFAPAPGFAQTTNSGPATLSGAQSRQLRGAGAGPGSQPVPAALPGTKTSVDAAAPTRDSLDLSPTDALFDAINRGDAASARDAVNRGANLGARNVLGLTPMDLTVDLARNDITFLLLSMRGDDTAGRRDRDADRRAEPVTSLLQVRKRPGPPEVRGDEPVRVVAPRAYSGGGGAPIPSAGFVGFNGGR